MLTRYRLFVLTLGFTGASSGLAFETQCPETIETTQQLVAPAQPGWTDFSRDPSGTAGDPSSERLRIKSGFAHIEVYDGPPKELADLMPDNERDTWTLGDPKGRGRPKFMACCCRDAGSHCPSPASRVAHIPQQAVRRRNNHLACFLDDEDRQWYLQFLRQAKLRL